MAKLKIKITITFKDDYTKSIVTCYKDGTFKLTVKQKLWARLTGYGNEAWHFDAKGRPVNDVHGDTDRLQGFIFEVLPPSLAALLHKELNLWLNKV